jgi:putative membrane protein
MRHTALAAIGVVLLLAGSNSVLAAQDDATFLNTAIGINLAEIQMGQLAQKNGSTAAVRDYGATLVKDHSANNQEAMALAKKMNITAANKPSDQDQQMYQDLSAKKGADFDKSFAQEMVDGHQKAIQLFTDEANSASGDVKNFAQNTLPTLKSHLAMAQKLLNNADAVGMNQDQNGAAAAPSQAGAAGATAASTPTPPSATTPMVEPTTISATDLRNATVYDDSNRKIGSVSDVILDKSGKIDAVVLDVGGFLGIGAKPVALAFDDLQFRRDANKYLYVYSKFNQQQLEQAPKYDKNLYDAQRDKMRLHSTTNSG